MNNIGIVGCDGREHAIGKKLTLNSSIQLFYIGNHSNIGLDILKAIYTNIDINNTGNIVNWAVTNKLDMVIIGPEKPLELGVVDLLEDAGILCVGPRKILASLETSKLFCRNFLKTLEKDNYKLNPDYFEFTNKDEFTLFIENYDKPFVIKQDTLAGGKGVQVMGDHFNTKQEAVTICTELYNKNIPFIIEEKLEGEEFSLISFTDGTNISHCPPIQDYKRAYEDNNGPNTGGMGAIMNYLMFLLYNDIKTAEKINESVIHNISSYIKDNKYKYKGILYGSFIKTREGIRVIEYNCRFGDPEVIPLLESMKSNFMDICTNIVKGTLTNHIEFDIKPVLTKYIVPEGYPRNSLKNYEFYAHKLDPANITWASCYKKDEHYTQLGSRIFAYTLKGRDIVNLHQEMNTALSKVQGRLFYRKDIGDFTKTKYAAAGVDIMMGNKIVKEIQPFIKSTETASVLSNIGGFNSMIQLGDNIVVSSMDGVGTKSIFTKQVLGNKGFINLGMDLVNHCINDILVSGAKPFLFLDYFASSKLIFEEVTNFVKGISIACQASNTILAGGETAEMPNVYKDSHCDLVGTIIGTVDKDKIINGKKNIKEGDVVLGLKAEGLHTNGFSLIRKLLEISQSLNKQPSHELLESLCRPHKSYLEDIMELLSKIKINGLCHITGGGFIDNPPRVLPSTLRLKINPNKLFKDPIYDWIKSLNYVSQEEMLEVFNCGYGMLVIISPSELDKLDNYDLLGHIEKK